MEIAEIQESMIDYPGRIANIIFTPGCNFRCPACHAKEIVEGQGNYTEERVLASLAIRKNWLDAVVLCGGEPTMQNTDELVDFLRRVRRAGFEVKLDTNGSNPEVVERLIEGRLVNYIALDIKAPRNMYNIVAGVDVDAGEIEKSMRVIAGSGLDYEFRTTVDPILRNGEISWMSIDEVGSIAGWVWDATRPRVHYLQPFVAREQGKMVDDRFCTGSLEVEMHRTPQELMQDMAASVNEKFSGYNMRVRGMKEVA